MMRFTIQNLLACMVVVSASRLAHQQGQPDALKHILPDTTVDLSQAGQLAQPLIVEDIVNPIILQMKQEFLQNPLVQHIKKVRNQGGVETDPFLPFMTFFVNSFSDLNRMVLPYPQNEILPADEGSRLKAIINEHCEEDSTHHHLFWNDLVHYNNFFRSRAQVGTFSDSVRFLWSDSLYDTRKVGYEVARLVGMAPQPIHRYCMIRVMEELGNVFFTTGLDYKMLGGVPSNYMSHDHLELEDGHLQNQKHESKFSTASLQTDQKKTDFEGEETSLHQDALTALFGRISFQSSDEVQTAKHVMKATFRLFDDMLRCAYNAMMEYGADKSTSQAEHSA